MGRVLLVEDDETAGAVLDASLNAQGHDVQWARTARAALAAERPAELVLLDLGLPDMDGVEVCRRLRTSRPDAVIVMLTARADEIDVVVGLDAGADDYLVKPVPLAELHARLRAHLRRSVPAAAPARPIVLGDLLVDMASRRVVIDGAELALRAREFDLLAHLAARAGHAVTRETLMADVWDENWFGSTKTLDVHVAALRRKLDGYPNAQLPAIVTLRGHGFRLELPKAAEETG
jgi:DNA-binding response OmpR family regulator